MRDLIIALIASVALAVIVGSALSVRADREAVDRIYAGQRP